MCAYELCSLSIVFHFVHVLLVLCSVSVFFFFFQAEDGIRDLVRSRGLGDVYKRQALANLGCTDKEIRGRVKRELGEDLSLSHIYRLAAVSYKHLTLPTIYSV